MICDLSWWTVLILGAVQGITEFLPISSSGHLVILEAMFAASSGRHLEAADLNIVLHVGTLFSILVFYWRKVLSLLAEDRRVVPVLAIATIPVVLAGVPVKKWCEPVLESPVVAGAMLIVTGCLLLWSSRRRRQSGDYQKLGYSKAFWIGLAQAAAVLPGLSRSGATISVALASGLSARSAATFSFLMAIPAIAGAGLYQVWQLAGQRSQVSSPWELLLLGAVTAFAVGCGSLWWLVRLLERGKFHWFAWWCLPVGAIVLLWQFLA